MLYSHFASVSFCHPINQQSTHIKKRTTSSFSKTKSLFFSALIALQPAQWALLRVQRYTLLMNYTISFTLFITNDNDFYDFITFVSAITTANYEALGFNQQFLHLITRKTGSQPLWLAPY